MVKPVPGSIAESEHAAEAALDEFERAIRESIARRGDAPNSREAIRERRLALLKSAAIRILLER